MQEKKLNKAVSDVKLMKTPEGKTEVKNAVKDATKKVESKVGDVAEAAAKKAEVVEEKAKEVAKATTKAVVEKAEPVVKKAATKAKAATKVKKEKQPAKTEIIVQYQQNAANLGELEDKVKKQFVAEGHRAGCIKTLNIYVKPEEYKAYYVINDKFFGSVDLF
ncbi:MAG: DUF6465 family protein [Roseburia faecis]|mgnify:FL=1|jgi:cell division septum initiation protein DivIVA|nr:DUF6465 family protein [Lachnospiraceae bacterium]MDY6280685.1 DUF6465 family protein [Roseburia faecis]MDY6311773.1 DUF6465 family protein [Lachnospiraceae bacterium]MDY6360005.1 DUF6465 family protein [Lachnospiraceae bacterium]